MVNTSDEGSPRTAVEERAKALFDESAGHLDGRTRSALTQARHAALAELEEHKRRGVARLWGPLGGIAAAAVVVAVLFGPLWTTTRQGPDSAMPFFEDFDIVADADNLELLEDLEFYAWLDSESLPDG